MNDDADDLMYSGPGRELLPPALDAAHDDYYLHGIPGCLDLATSPYLGLALAPELSQRVIPQVPIPRLDDDVIPAGS